jgi:hypothetical protein
MGSFSPPIDDDFYHFVPFGAQGVDDTDEIDSHWPISVPSWNILPDASFPSPPRGPQPKSSTLQKPAWALTPEEYQELGDQYENWNETQDDGEYIHDFFGHEEWGGRNDSEYYQSSLFSNASKSIDTFKEETANFSRRRNAFLFEVDDEDNSDETRYDLSPGGILISSSSKIICDSQKNQNLNAISYQRRKRISNQALLQLIIRKIKDVQTKNT